MSPGFSEIPHSLGSGGGAPPIKSQASIQIGSLISTLPSALASAAATHVGSGIPWNSQFRIRTASPICMWKSPWESPRIKGPTHSDGSQFSSGPICWSWSGFHRFGQVSTLRRCRHGRCRCRDLPGRDRRHPRVRLHLNPAGWRSPPGYSCPHHCRFRRGRNLDSR